MPGTRFIFSDLLEQAAPETDKREGNDLADFLIKQDWKQYRKREGMKEPQPQPKPEKVTEVTEVTHEKNIIFSDNEAKPQEPVTNEADFLEGFLNGFDKLQNDSEPKQNDFKPDWDWEFWNKKKTKEQPKNWNNEIAEIETYFVAAELPTQPVKLNECSTITDCSLFIETHLATVKANNGKETFLPYLNRLQEFKQVLTINSN